MAGIQLCLHVFQVPVRSSRGGCLTLMRLFFLCRLIEQETGASMLLHLAIWGSSDAIEMARDMVNEILDGESGSEQAILQGVSLLAKLY